MVVLQEAQRPIDVLLVEPGRVPELDGDRDPLEAPLSVEDRVAVLGRGEEPARVLEEHRAQLAALPEGLQALSKLPPELVEELGRKLLAVNPRLGAQVVGHLLPQGLWQALRLGGLARHESVRFDIEREVGRRPVDP